MDAHSLARKLIRWTTVGLGVLIVSAALGLFGLHIYGAHRLENARSDFDARWGHLVLDPPPTSLPDHENGARWLLAGGQATICSLEDRRFISAISAESARGWTDTEQARARWILAARFSGGGSWTIFSWIDLSSKSGKTIWFGR